MKVILFLAWLLPLDQILAEGDGFPEVTSSDDVSGVGILHVVKRQERVVAVIKESSRDEQFEFGERTESVDGEFVSAVYQLVEKGGGKTKIELIQLNADNLDDVILVFVDKDFMIYRDKVSRVIWDGILARAMETR